MKRRIWSTKQKLVGNLLPAFIIAPVAMYTISTNQGDPVHIVRWTVVTIAVGWLSLNLLALFGNNKMRTALTKEISSADQTECYFVGAARPAYRSLLDPHEDIGFLVLKSNHLEFTGEILDVRLSRKDIVEIKFTPNVHTLLGLGGFVSIRAISGDRKVRLLIEPREHSILLANLFLSFDLIRRLRDWAEKK